MCYSLVMLEEGGFMKIVKRDGHIVDYCPEKIENAILNYNKKLQSYKILE